MRILILALVAYIAAVVSFWRPRGWSGQPPADAPPDSEKKAGGGQDFPNRLADAAATFGAAARAKGLSPPFRDALSRLSDACATLHDRVSDQTGFARRNRVPILRLLFPLYGVVHRVTQLAGAEQTAESAALLTSAQALVERSIDALHRATDRADAIAMKHLEADLELLEERLSE